MAEKAGFFKRFFTLVKTVMTTEERHGAVNRKYTPDIFVNKVITLGEDQFRERSVKSLMGKGISPIFDVPCHSDFFGTKVD